MKEDLVLIIQRLHCLLRRINKSVELGCFFKAGVLLFILSCNNTSLKKKSTGDLKRMDVYLNDSVGVISFNEPIRYDTTFSWIHYSDCNTCHEQKYRFQSKRNPIIKETGYVWPFIRSMIGTFLHRKEVLAQVWI